MPARPSRLPESGGGARREGCSRAGEGTLLFRVRACTPAALIHALICTLGVGSSTHCALAHLRLDNFDGTRAFGGIFITASRELCHPRTHFDAYSASEYTHTRRTRDGTRKLRQRATTSRRSHSPTANILTYSVWLAHTYRNDPQRHRMRATEQPEARF